jgi:hypothetical protein
MRLFAVVALVCALAGCAPTEPAPEDLDGLAHWFWRNQGLASHAELLDAVDTLDAVVGELDEPRTGTLGLLSEDEANVVERDRDQDPADAFGFFIASRYPCTLERMEEIATTPEQDELYPGVFDEYQRTDTADRSAYFARQSDTLTWDVALSVTPVTSQYRANSKGGVRRPVDDGRSAITQTTWLPSPADFDDESSHFKQDYQMEVYYPRGDDVVHLYGMWRDMKVGIFSIEDDAFLGALVSGLMDWEARSAELCAEGS